MLTLLASSILFFHEIVVVLSHCPTSCGSGQWDILGHSGKSSFRLLRYRSDKQGGYSLYRYVQAVSWLVLLSFLSGKQPDLLCVLHCPICPMLSHRPVYFGLGQRDTWNG